MQMLSTHRDHLHGTFPQVDRRNAHDADIPGCAALYTCDAYVVGCDTRIGRHYLHHLHIYINHRSTRRNGSVDAINHLHTIYTAKKKKKEKAS